jgi:hypothetical protein
MRPPLLSAPDCVEKQALRQIAAGVHTVLMDLRKWKLIDENTLILNRPAHHVIKMVGTVGTYYFLSPSAVTQQS